MHDRLLGFVVLVTVLAWVPPAHADVRRALQLDSAPSGDLLLYATDTGRWFNALFDPAVDGGFAVRSGQWLPDWTVLAARYDDNDLTDAFLYDAATGEYAWALNADGRYDILRGSWSPGWTLFVADFNGDHRHDIFRYDVVSGEWSQCLNVGSGQFTCLSGAMAPGRDIVAADFDGDERTDVLSYDPATGQFDRHLTSTNGLGFSSTRSGVWSPGWHLAAINLNGDRSADLVLYHPISGDWYQAVSTTDDRMFDYAGARGLPGLQIVPADLDGNGIDDIMAYDPGSGRWFEAFTASGGLGFGSFADGRWAAGWEIHATDFDRDGRADIFLYDPVNGAYFQCLNIGAGAFHYTGGHSGPGLVVTSTVNNVVAGTDVVDHPTLAVLRTPRILAFGDSITFGTHSRYALPADRSHASYPSQLTALLKARYPTQTITMANLGIPGETADDGRKRIGAAIDVVQPDVLLLLEGINDLNGGGDPVSVTNDLEDMIAIARSKGVEVLVATLTPVTSAGDPTGVVAPKILTVNSRLSDIVKVYSLTAPVDLYGAMVGNLSLLGADGLHPTDDGYEVMARTFFTAITQRFEILTSPSAMSAAMASPD